MENDTLVVGRAIRAIEYSIPTYNKFLQPGISKEDYIKSPEGLGLILSYNPFELQSKGITLLENYTSTQSLDIEDTLVEDIIANHARFKKVLNITFENISKDVSEQMRYLKNNEPWIGDLLLGKLNNPKMFDYYVSDTHRARLAIHYTLVNGNLLPILIQFQSKTKTTLVLLEKRLEED